MKEIFVLKRAGRTSLLVSGVTLAADWFLDVVRFRWSALTSVFAAVSLPWTIDSISPEGQPTSWPYGCFGRAVDDQMGQIVAFRLMVGLQAMLFATLLTAAQPRRARHDAEQISYVG